MPGARNQPLPTLASSAFPAALALSVLLVVCCLPALCQPPPADRGQQVLGLVAAGKLEEAVEACRGWVKEDPEATRPHLLLGDVYTKLKLWDRAADEYRQVLELNPASATALVRLGDLFRTQGKIAEAKQAYEQSLAIKDKTLEAYLGLAALSLENGNPNEARPYVDMALEIAPDDAQVIALAGEVERLSGNRVQAGEKFKLALEKDPKCADALYGMGILVQAQGDWAEEEAQKYWDRFLEAEKDTERAWRVRYGLVDFGRRIIPSSPGIDQRPVFSPDGKLLAFAGTPEGVGPVTGWEIYVVPADGSAPPKAITAGGGAIKPRWTSDGKQIVFDFYYEPGGLKRVYITSATGDTEPRGLTEDMRLARGATPIPGTDRILFTDAWTLYTMKMDGSDRQRLAVKVPQGCETDYLCPSPDGKSVAFPAGDFTKDWGPAYQVYVAPLEGSSLPKPLTSEDTKNRLGNLEPSWGPDGKRIIFSTDVNHRKHHFDTYAVVLGDPRPPVLLIRNGGRASWSPDGTKIAFDCWTDADHGAICVMDLGGKRLPVVRPGGA